MIEFQLDTGSGVATYLQLVQQVHQALQLGLLQPGDQLPTAQQVVGKLAINPNTVLKAPTAISSGLAWCGPGRARELSSSGHSPVPTPPPRHGFSPR
jgi:GntR family transcriptional regulator